VHLERRAHIGISVHKQQYITIGRLGQLMAANSAGPPGGQFFTPNQE